MNSGVDCSWTITCQAGAILRLEVFYSDMESMEGQCADQEMRIYDGTRYELVMKKYILYINKK